MRRLRRQRNDLMEEVGVLHSALVPEPSVAPVGLRVSTGYRPADGAMAGGGFDEAFGIGTGRFGVVVGSVSGGGREGVIEATALRHAMRGYLKAGLEPREAIRLASAMLNEDPEAGLATVVAAVYDRRGGRLTFAGVANPTPIFLGVPGPLPVEPEPMAPLGMEPWSGVQQTTIPLVPGAVACFYSDGLVEARAEGEVIGEKRLRAIAAELGDDLSAESLLERVAAEATSLANDMAACVIRGDREAVPGRLRAEEIELVGAYREDRLTAFLSACGVGAAETDRTTAAALELSREGAVLVRVEFGTRPQVSLRSIPVSTGVVSAMPGRGIRDTE